MVFYWVCGEKEMVYILDNKIKIVVLICVLGGFVVILKIGVIVEVVEVKSIKELNDLGEKVKGKIVFYNRLMDFENIEIFIFYGGAGD